MDVLIGQVLHHSVLGRFARLWGPWKGEYCLPDWDDPMELLVEVSAKDRATELLDTLAALEGVHLREAIRSDLYQSYCFFKKMDIEEAGIAESEFDKFPAVTNPADVVGACRPYRMRIGEEIDSHLGNTFILFEVDWPSDHMLQVFWNMVNGALEYKHVELFG